MTETHTALQYSGIKETLMTAQIVEQIVVELSKLKYSNGRECEWSKLNRL